MKVLFEQSFAKDLKKVKDRRILDRVATLIQEVKEAENIQKIKNIRKLKGFDSYYRIRVGNFRIGIDLDNETIVFVRILLRKDIYKYFP